MSAQERDRRRPPTRPRTWQWMLAAGSLAGSLIGGIVTNVLADVVNQNLGSVTGVAIVVAAVAVGVLVMLEVRKRRAVQSEVLDEPPPAVPVQPPGAPTDLPYTSGFVGRGAAVDWLVRSLRSERAVALVGRRAVGTSACVVEAANLVRDQYPDGQLYLDLRPGERPLRPRQVVDALCRRLNLDQSAPERGRDLVSTARILRDRVGDRRVLIVLDNASEPEQVRLLLPPAAHCHLLIAGTVALERVPQLRLRRLDEPPPDEAAALLADTAADAGWGGHDLRADPAVRELIELVGRQPQVVRVLGARMGAHGWAAPEQLAALRRALDRPSQPDPTLAMLAGRDRAYVALGSDARRLYRLLALTDQPLSRNAIAALTGVNRGRTDRVLAELESAAFVTAVPDGRYQLRELLAEYARIHLNCTEPPRRQLAARHRLLRYLTRVAERYVATRSDAEPGSVPANDPGADWFERNDALLRSMVVRTGAAAVTPGARPSDASASSGVTTAPSRPMRRWWLRLAVALCAWYAAQDRLDAWATICQTVLDSPLARQRAAVAGWAHNERGAIFRLRGEPHRAADELALAVTRRHRRGAAQSRTNLGLALLDQHDVDGALDQLQRARRQRSPADRAGQALTELGLGAAFLARNEPALARRHLILAANRFDAVGDRRGYAAALTNLVIAQWWLGEHLDAAHAWSAALEHYERAGDTRGHAVALLNAGAAMARGDRRRALRAREVLLESLRLRQGTPLPTGRVLLNLGDAAETLSETDEARRYWSGAAEACHLERDDDGAEWAARRLARTEATSGT